MDTISPKYVRWVEGLQLNQLLSLPLSLCVFAIPQQELRDVSNNGTRLDIVPIACKRISTTPAANGNSCQNTCAGRFAGRRQLFTRRAFYAHAVEKFRIAPGGRGCLRNYMPGRAVSSDVTTEEPVFRLFMSLPSVAQQG